MKKLIILLLLSWSVQAQTKDSLTLYWCQGTLGVLAPMPQGEVFLQILETREHLTLIHNTRGAIVGRIVSRDSLDGSIVAQFEANRFRVQITRSGALTNFRFFRVISGPDYIIISDRRRKY